MDRFKLGNLELDALPSYATRGYWLMRVRHGARIGRVPRLIYTWDCALEPNGNPARPKAVPVRTEMNFDVLVPPKGAINSGASSQNRVRFMKRAGFHSDKAFRTALDKVFGVQNVPIRWLGFSFQMNPIMKVRFYGWVEYADVYVRPTQPGYKAQFMISVPVSIRVQGITYDTCPGPILPYFVGTDQRSPSIQVPHAPTSKINADRTPSEILRALHERSRKKGLKEHPDTYRKAEARAKRAADARMDRLFKKTGLEIDDGF